MVGYTQVKRTGICLMNALKVLGTLLLGGLLFLSLLILGMAFTLQSTVLNADFVADQAKKMDIAALVREITEEQTAGQRSPEEEFIIETVYRVIEDREPWLKQQLDSAIHAGYDFLLGKTDRLFISVPLGELKEDLKESLWQTVTEDPDTWLPIFQAYLNDYIDAQLATLVEDIRPYLPPDLADLPLETLRPQLSDYLLPGLTSMNTSMRWSPTYRMKYP
jgi:hypothetical protein